MYEQMKNGMLEWSDLDDYKKKLKEKITYVSTGDA